MRNAAFMVSVVLSGCGLFDSTSSSGTSETVTLDAVSTSAESGTAIFTDLGNSTTQVSITSTGGTDTGAQTAVMREGACGDSGTIYAELNSLVSRQSITTLPYALSTLTGSKYYIDIHDSTSIDVIDACGGVQ